MNILIIDNGTKHLGKLKELLNNHNIQTINYLDPIPDLKDIDLVILTGNSIFPLFYNQDIYKNEVELIKNSKRPIIGICFGCELIAYVFGAKMEKLKAKVKGVKTIRALGTGSIPLGLNSFDVYESHSWTIANPGKKLEGLARSKYGFEMIKHNTKPIYGLQFHPEMCTDETFGDEIFLNLVHQISNV